MKIKSKILYLLLYLIFTGCSQKEEFILFNKAEERATHPVTSQVDRYLDQKIPVVEADQPPTVEQQPFAQRFEKREDVAFEYKIAPYDRVAVIVYEHPEFSTSTAETRASDRGLLVNAKGDIRLPLIKSVHVGGLTQTEAQELVEAKFQRYLKSPDIYLEVLNKRAYVIGEVKHPGEIELTNEKLSLIQAIAKAGDLTDEANRRAIMILRATPRGGVEKEMVDLTDVNSLSVASLMIKPNDIVYVLPNDIKAFNVSINEINPVFRLISDILSPFVSIKYLSD